MTLVFGNTTAALEIEPRALFVRTDGWSVTDRGQTSIHDGEPPSAGRGTRRLGSKNEVRGERTARQEASRLTSS
jgi:hypothetical protein